MSTSAGLSAMSTKIPDITVDAASTQSGGEHLPINQENSELFKRRIMYVHIPYHSTTSHRPSFDSSSRKVDCRMLPLLGVLSALSLIDRSNLGLARTAGMDHALVCRLPLSSLTRCER